MGIKSADEQMEYYDELGEAIEFDETLNEQTLEKNIKEHKGCLKLYRLAAGMCYGTTALSLCTSYMGDEQQFFYEVLAVVTAIIGTSYLDEISDEKDLIKCNEEALQMVRSRKI